MKKPVFLIILFLISIAVFPQKVNVQVVKLQDAIPTEWQILDENYRLIFGGSEVIKSDTVTFSLDESRRYFFSVSFYEKASPATELISLAVNGEPLILVISDLGTGDHFIPFFTGVRQRQTKITGGDQASIATYPWQVFVIGTYSNTTLSCGGSIIAPGWILTAAHCTRKSSGAALQPSEMRIKAGAENPRISSEGVTYSVAQIIPHENYDDATIENDLALLKLTDNINTPNATPIRLISNVDVAFGATDPGVMAWVTGWGLTRVEPQTFPTSLQVVQLPIVTNQQAAKVWGKDIPLTDLMAGFLSGNKDACSGDSGGPLTVSVLGEKKLAGIVSWGSQQCDTYGGYTRVSMFLEWIRSKTGITTGFLPPSPEGDTVVCRGTTSSQYTMASVSGTSSFEWKLYPSEAGAVSGNLTSASVAWNTSFTGMASLAFRVTQSGQLSEWSRLQVFVAPQTKVLSKSDDIVICEGERARLYVRAEGHNLLYSWFRNGTLVQSSSSDSLVFQSALPDESGDYTVEITGKCGSVISGVLHLTVYHQTSITDVTPDSVVPFGTNFILEVTAEGNNLAYQWQKDGNVVPGANGPQLLLEQVNATQIGNYSVTVSGTCGTETRDSIYIFVMGKASQGGPDVFLWPSVTKGLFNVAISSDDVYNLTIVNAMGQLMRSYTGLRYQNEKDISDLPKGMYFITVYNKDFRKSLKLIRN